MAFDLKKIILLIGIVFIPFYEIIIKLFPDALVATPDTREAKTALTLIISLLFVAVSLVEGIEIKVNNKWLLALIVFLPISIHLSTYIPLIVNGVDSSSFWVWKPFSYILAYFCMFLCVANIKFCSKSLKLINYTIYYSSLIMAFYILLQWLGVDQFYAAKTYEQVGHVPNSGLVGNLGQPTLVAPFIAVGTIFAYRLKKLIPALFMILILVLLDSMMALGAIFCATILYIVLNRPKALYVFIPVLLLISALLVIKFDVQYLNGRGTVFKQTVVDWKTSPVSDGGLKSPSYTGIGMGSYQYLFSEKNGGTFKQAHCEPLEILYSLGLIGLLLYVMANIDCLKKAYIARRNDIITYISAFILLHLISLGTLVWQISTYQYLGIILFGLLSNNSILQGEES